MSEVKTKTPSITKIILGNNSTESISHGENHFLKYLVMTLVKIRTETIYDELGIKRTDNKFNNFILEGFDCIERQPEYNTISSIEKDILKEILSLNSVYQSTKSRPYTGGTVSGSTTSKILTYLKNNYSVFYDDFKHFIIETTELVNPTGTVNKYHDEIVVYPFIQVVDDTMTIDFIKTYPANMTFRIDMETGQTNRIDRFISAYTHPVDNEVNDHLNCLTHAMILFASFNLPKFNTTNNYTVFEIFSRENLVNNLNYLSSKKLSIQHLDVVKTFVTNLVSWDVNKLSMLKEKSIQTCRKLKNVPYTNLEHSIKDIAPDRLTAILLRKDEIEILANIRRLIIGISSTIVNLISTRFNDISLFQVYHEINMYIIGKEIQNTDVVNTLLSKYNNVIDQEALIFNKEDDAEDEEDQKDVEPDEAKPDGDSKEEEEEPTEETEEETDVENTDSDTDEDADISDSSDSNDDPSEDDDSGDGEENSSSDDDDEEDEEHTDSNVVQYEKDYGNIDNFLAKRRMYKELINISLTDGIDEKFVTCIKEYLKYFIWITDISNTELLIKNLRKELKLK